MKIKSAVKIACFLLLLASAGLQSCKSKSNLLVGTWRIESLKYEEELPAEMQTAVNTWVQSMEENYSITYRADGTFTATSAGQSTEGKWHLNWNNTQISNTGPDGKERNFEIVELNPGKFVFKVTEETQSAEGKKSQVVIFAMVPKK